jgi:hypothetical protein
LTPQAILARGDGGDAPPDDGEAAADVPTGILTSGAPMQVANEKIDANLSNAARALRVLHVAALRRVQAGVNAAIARMQAATANPKTDASLGRVGRWGKDFLWWDFEYFWIKYCVVWVWLALTFKK